MVTLHFYGDSWTIEHDHEQRVNPCMGYPSMIGQQLDLPVCNYAIAGNSQLSMVDQFTRSPIKPGDHAVFSLSAPSRRFYFDQSGIRKNVPVDMNKESINDYQDSWLSAVTCALLNDLGKQRSCRIWLVNIFNVSYQQDWAHPLWDHIDSTNWLLPPDRCLVQDLFDPEWFGQQSVFRNSDFYDWLATNNEQVGQCIRPCENHPNLVGRTRIANFIADKLITALEIGEPACQY